MAELLGVLPKVKLGLELKSATLKIFIEAPRYQVSIIWLSGVMAKLSPDEIFLNQTLEEVLVCLIKFPSIRLVIIVYIEFPVIFTY